jgi:probable DNA metabolism protein
MKCYTYDGSFAGLLTCIYEAYYKEMPDKIEKASLYNPNFIYEEIYIETDMDKYRKVYSAIKKKISETSLKNIYYVYLSELKDCDTLILKYVRLGFRVGADIDLFHNNDIVFNIHNLCEKVSHETLRMLEFIRFKNIEDSLYYSAIEPDHNLLPVITNHFKNRLPDQNFIIHDIKRNQASVYNKKEWVVIKLTREEGDKLQNKSDQALYENLWRDYFASIAIKERKNEKLQKSHMPKRYWKHMIEMK